MEKEALIKENTEIKGINANKTYVADVRVFIEGLHSSGSFCQEKSKVLDWFLVEPILKDEHDYKVVGFKEIITGEQVITRNYCDGIPWDYDIKAVSYVKNGFFFGPRIKYDYRHKNGDLCWSLQRGGLAVKLLDEEAIAKYLEQTPEEIRSKIEYLRNNAYDDYMNAKHYVKVRKK